jgi:hypothetical protein
MLIFWPILDFEAGEFVESISKALGLKLKGSLETGQLFKISFMKNITVIV